MLKINLIENTKKEKPSKKEYGIIQKTICSEENVKKIDFETFVDLVGNNGAIWKSSFMEGGAKNINFKCAYMLSLDFDNGISINEFLENAKDLGLEPTFIYETFSSTNEFNRFRAIWKLKEVIEYPQLKTALQLMLMEVFSDCDSACKDLSRLWIGGKNVAFYNPMNTLNIENLLNATVNSITLKEPTQVNRNMKAFCKKIGINIYNKQPFIIKKTLKNVENRELFHIQSYREVPENRQKLDFFNYDNFEFSFTDSFDIDKNKNVSAKIQAVKGDKAKILKIDFEKLSTKCGLFGDFLNGKKLNHKEIQHLSFNLYDCKGYPTILKDTLMNNNYNNWQNKYNTYVSAVNYNYAPTNCSNYCEHYFECQNPINIKSKYYQKENKAKKIEDIPTITLSEAEKELNKMPSIIKSLTKNDFMLLNAPVGIGKTELLMNIDLNNTIIGVTNHRLGEELNERLSKRDDIDLLYVRPLNMTNIPDDLRNLITNFYDLGLYGEVKNVIFEEIKRLNTLNKEENTDYPIYYNDLVFYVEQLKQIPNASSLLFTHHRISFGNQNNKIDTLILDEDFLKTFIKYDVFNRDEIFNDFRNLIAWANRFNHINNKHYNDYIELKNYIEAFSLELSCNEDKWIENILNEITLNPKFRRIITQYMKENKNSLKTNFFKVIGAKGISLTKNGFIHIIDGKSLRELEDYKVICMSATLDETIHTAFIKKYLPNKNIIYKSIANTELKGNIYCNCSYAWSRDGLKKLTKKSEKALQKILNDDRYENIITFKSNDLINLEGTGKVKIAHFGAVEGLDKYKGQNLCVIGTPHTSSKVYEGYYFLLTGKNNISREWKVKRVKKYGFEFDLNTYENETDIFLTDIQLYFVYSELIQAIGRARALRFNVDIFVYSALPIPNSKLS